MIKIYTDGACSGNPGEGGWGLVIENDGTIVRTKGGYSSETTNNRMELTATIKALEYSDSKTIEIHTDSNYVKKGITSWINNWKSNGWKTSSKDAVKNKDLWQKLDKLNSENVKWYYVPGHTGVKLNEIADDIATNMIKYNQNNENGE